MFTLKVTQSVFETILETLKARVEVTEDYQKIVDLVNLIEGLKEQAGIVGMD